VNSVARMRKATPPFSTTKRIEGNEIEGGNQMTTSAITQSQRTAAKAVGFVYLLAIVLSLFAGAYVNASLFVYDNAAETARNIMAHEQLFRLGIASDLISFAADVVLLTALYVVLEPVNRPLALLAACWRLLECTLFVAITLNNFDVLRVLSGADYVRGFEADQLQTMARLSIGAHNAGYNVGLVFAGLGSTLFCYLWFKSRYIPRPLAAWGVFSSLLLAVSTFVFIIFPDLAKALTVGTTVGPILYGGPIFIFELAMGFWLLVKGIREPARR
jgi:Domain of unknown function (DUF4386)